MPDSCRWLKGAIVGGRNLTAEYFSDDQAQNFADLDVLVGGAIVQRLSSVFDEYWNSDEAYPIGASLENSYAVRLSADRQSLDWSTLGLDGEAHYSSEPDAGFLRRVLTPLLRVTVPEGIL